MPVETESVCGYHFVSRLQDQLHFGGTALEELAHAPVENAVASEQHRLGATAHEEQAVVPGVARSHHCCDRPVGESHTLIVIEETCACVYLLSGGANNRGLRPLLGKSMVVACVVVVLVGSQDSKRSATNLPIVEYGCCHIKVAGVHQELKLPCVVLGEREDSIAQVVLQEREGQHMQASNFENLHVVFLSPV